MVRAEEMAVVALEEGELVGRRVLVAGLDSCLSWMIRRHAEVSRLFGSGEAEKFGSLCTRLSLFD